MYPDLITRSQVELPAPLARASRASRIPWQLRAVVRRLGPISIEVRLAGTDVPPGIAHLAKLSSLEPDALPLTMGEEALGSAWVLARRGAAEERLEGDVLRGNLEALVVAIVSALVPPDLLVRQCIQQFGEIEDLARHDPETGLLNRKELEARLAQERSRAHRAKTGLALMLVGLDDVPPGHRGGEPGDSVFRAAGALLREELRALDVAARFDEGELAVVLPGAGALEAAHVARRVGVAAHERGLSLSMGVAAFPEDCDHPDDLVRLAGLHLSAARDGGRGRACLSEDGEPIVFSSEGG